MVRLPEALTAGLEITSTSPISGGDISRAYRLETSDGPLFCKMHANPSPGLFEREAAGLRLLRDNAPAELGVPEVLREDPHGLLLEWIEPGRRGGRTEPDFGRGLAGLHQVTRPTFGTMDECRVGYLGSVQVSTEPAATWAEFFWEMRVRPLARRAVDLGRLDPVALRLVDALEPRVAEHCGPDEPASLLHGDLWAGNRMVDASGRNWLIDPAVHWGHREYDLAMMQLFGGFGGDCFRAYDEVFPLAEGWTERVEWNQLPPLMVHAILFGGGYGSSVVSVLRRYR